MECFQKGDSYCILIIICMFDRFSFKSCSVFTKSVLLSLSLYIVHCTLHCLDTYKCNCVCNCQKPFCDTFHTCAHFTIQFFSVGKIKLQIKGYCSLLLLLSFFPLSAIYQEYQSNHSCNLLNFLFLIWYFLYCTSVARS